MICNTKIEKCNVLYEVSVRNTSLESPNSTDAAVAMVDGRRFGFFFFEFFSRSVKPTKTGSHPSARLGPSPVDSSLWFLPTFLSSVNSNNVLLAFIIVTILFQVFLVVTFAFAPQRFVRESIERTSALILFSPFFLYIPVM
jgi:hypothetical protein